MAEDCQEHGDRIILFVGVALVIGVLVKTINQLHPLLDAIPFSASMLIAGIIVGSINIGADFGVLGKAVDMMAEIDAHLFLSIFIPPVVFRSASKVNYHLMEREGSQALILAFPGVIISLILIAVVARYFFDYGWDWFTALMFGAILSATDPVAVVSILGSLGAPKQLSTLIEGESLLNDGSAYVLFLLWKDYVTGDHRDVGEAVVYLIRLTFGAIALGLAAGFFLVGWLSIIQNTVAEISLTVAAAFLVFYVSESEELGVHVSGILATVVMGLTLSRFNTCISRKSQEPLDHFWETFSAFFDLVIFFLTGIIVAEQLFAGADRIEGRDLGYLFMLYVLLFVIRAIEVIILYPILANLGYGFDWKAGVIVTYGGLRGAVSLALALIVELERDIGENIKKRTLFLVSGIVVLTILINGTTTGSLLEYLGLTDAKASERRAFRLALMTIYTRARGIAENLMESPYYSDADWRVVRQWIPKLFRRNSIGETDEQHEKAGKIQKDEDAKASGKETKGGSVHSRSDICFEKDLVSEVRHRLLLQMGADFRRDYKEQFLSRDSIQVLEEATAQAIDKDDLGELWSTIERHFRTARNWRFLSRLWPTFGSTVAMEQTGHAIELTLSFYHACSNFDELRNTFDGPNFTSYIDQQQEEVMLYREKAVDRLKAVMEEYPEDWRCTQTKKTLLVLHSRVEETVKHLFDDGLLLEREYNLLDHKLDKSMRKIRYMPSKWLQLKDTWPEDTLENLTFWPQLTDTMKAKISSAAFLRFEKGENVYECKEMKRGGILLLAEGNVKVTYTEHGREHTDLISISECVGLCDFCRNEARLRNAERAGTATDTGDKGSERSLLSEHGNQNEEQQTQLLPKAQHEDILSSRCGKAIVVSKHASGFYVSLDTCRSLFRSKARDILWKLVGVAVIRLFHRYDGGSPSRSELERVLLTGDLTNAKDTEKKFEVTFPILILQGGARQVSSGKVVREGSLIGVSSSFAVTSAEEKVIEKSGDAKENVFVFEPRTLYVLLPHLELALTKPEAKGSVQNHIPAGIANTSEWLRHAQAVMLGKHASKPISEKKVDANLGKPGDNVGSARRPKDETVEDGKTGDDRASDDLGEGNTSQDIRLSSLQDCGRGHDHKQG